MWDLPGPGLEPVSPALTGGFLTTAPPGNSLNYCLNLYTYVYVCAFERGMMYTICYPWLAEGAET